MHFKLLTPSKYLGAADLLGGEPTYKILRVAMEDVEEEPETKGAPPKVKKKGLIHLEGCEKGWLLNVTNAKALATMFGDETDKWPGHLVTLKSEVVLSFGERGPAVRVKGSPELSGPLSFTVKRRKKKDMHNLVKTGQTNGKPKTNGTAPDLTAHYREAMALIGQHLPANGAGAFLTRVTGKSKKGEVDANDVGLVKTALAAEFPAPPNDNEPPPLGDSDGPI